jgi:hypothetical protein
MRWSRRRKMSNMAWGWGVCLTNGVYFCIAIRGHEFVDSKTSISRSRFDSSGTALTNFTLLKYDFVQCKENCVHGFSDCTHSSCAQQTNDSPSKSCTFTDTRLPICILHSPLQVSYHHNNLLSTTAAFVMTQDATIQLRSLFQGNRRTTFPERRQVLRDIRSMRVLRRVLGRALPSQGRCRARNFLHERSSLLREHDARKLAGG